MSEILQIGLIIIGVSAGLSVLVGNVYYVIRSKNSKIKDEDISQLKEEVARNKVLLTACEARDKVTQAKVRDLEAKLNNTVSIPLKEISDHMKKTNEVLNNMLK